MEHTQPESGMIKGYSAGMHLAQVMQLLPEISIARAEYHELRRRRDSAELVGSQVNEDNMRLKTELTVLREAAADRNVPVAFYHHGGVIYGVHGTSSISYVEVLRGLILKFRDETEYVVPVPKEPTLKEAEFRQDQVDDMNKFGLATEADQFMPDAVCASEETSLCTVGTTKEERVGVLYDAARAEVAAGAGKYITELKDEIKQLNGELEALRTAAKNYFDRHDGVVYPTHDVAWSYKAALERVLEHGVAKPGSTNSVT